MDGSCHHMSWVPKHTLAELTSMRTEPILGIFPRRRDDMTVTETHKYEVRNCQFRPTRYTADMLCKVGESLIFYGPEDLLRGCAYIIGFDYDNDIDTRARLILAVELYSPHSRMQIAMAAIALAYDGEYWLNERRVGISWSSASCYVWKYSDNIDRNALLHAMTKFESIVAADAERDNAGYRIDCKTTYSKRTMQEFLMKTSPSRRGEFVYQPYTVMEYITSANNRQNIPLVVREFISSHSGCIECAIAAHVDRKCTQDHMEKQAAPIHADKSKDVYIVFKHAPACFAEPRYAEPRYAEPRYAEPAYFAPPPSAPPMEEMSHI